MTEFRLFVLADVQPALLRLRACSVQSISSETGFSGQLRNGLGKEIQAPKVPAVPKIQGPSAAKNGAGREEVKTEEKQRGSGSGSDKLGTALLVDPVSWILDPCRVSRGPVFNGL